MAFEGSPLTQMLRDTTTVRAEEIVLSVPDGRSVRTLLNVTPIRSSPGDPDGLAGILRAERPHLVLLDLMLPRRA